MGVVQAQTPAMESEPAQTAPSSTASFLPGFGTLFNGAWKHFMGHFGLFATIYLVPAIITLITGILYQRLLLSGGSMAIIGWILAVITFVIAIVGQLALFIAISNPEQTTFGSSISSAFKKFLPYLWFSIISGIVIVGMFGLLVIPGIIFLVYFSMASYIFVVEDVRGMNSLIKSLNYTWNHWWGLFGRILLFGIIIAVIYWVIMLIVGVVGMFAVASLGGGVTGMIIIGIITVILSTLITPFSYAFVFKLYESLKSIAVPTELNTSSGYKAKFLIPALIGIVLMVLFVGNSLKTALQSGQVGLPSSQFGSGLNLPNQGLDQNDSIYNPVDSNLPTSEGYAPNQYGIPNTESIP